MFEKYNINDLFLAIIYVTYPYNQYDVDCGGILKSGPSGFGYTTILFKKGDKYIDLQHKKAKISNIICPVSISYTISYMEPLSKYYTQDGKKKDTFGRRNAINMGRKYYSKFSNDHMKSIGEKNKNR